MNHTLVYVYRDACLGDCTGNGLSSRINKGILFWNCTSQEATKYCVDNGIDPSLQFILVNRNLWNEDHSYVEPLVKPTRKNQMFGGNFVYTSDGNFYKMGGLKTGSPIPIHDRFEDYM